MVSSDALELLEPGKVSFDDVVVTVPAGIKVAMRSSISRARVDRRGLFSIDICKLEIYVVWLIGQHCGRFTEIAQRIGLLRIVDLATDQSESYKLTKHFEALQNLAVAPH